MPNLKVYYGSNPLTQRMILCHHIADRITGDKEAYSNMIQNEANELYSIHRKKTKDKVVIYLIGKFKLDDN